MLKVVRSEIKLPDISEELSQGACKILYPFWHTFENT